MTTINIIDYYDGAEGIDEEDPNKFKIIHTFSLKLIDFAFIPSNINFIENGDSLITLVEQIGFPRLFGNKFTIVHLSTFKSYRCKGAQCSKSVVCRH